MKVFISWSGERSKAVALLLSEWIECVIQAVEPWVSSKDIDRGALWFSEINEQLANVSVGIVCLTGDNKDKPWILFESGALAKGLSTNRVCTFLVDLQPQDLENPLGQFNHTLPNREGVYQLIRTINSTLGDGKLKDNVIDSVFETYWPSFEGKFASIINDTPSDSVSEKRPEENILNEVLNTVRSMDKRLRTVENVPPAIKFKKLSVHNDLVKLNDDRLIDKTIITKFLKDSTEAGLSSMEIQTQLVGRFGMSKNDAKEMYLNFILDDF